MKFLALVVACLAVASVARAQDCPITAAEANKIDFKAVPKACTGVTNSPKFDACDTCAAALTQAFGPLYDKMGVECSSIPPSPGAGAQGNLAQALTPCINIIQGPMQKAGVNIMQLINLRNCPTDKYGPQLVAAIQTRCPDFAPAAVATSGR